MLKLFYIPVSLQWSILYHVLNVSFSFSRHLCLVSVKLGAQGYIKRERQRRKYMTRTLTYDRIKVLGLYETNKMFFSLSGPNLKRDKQPYIFLAFDFCRFCVVIWFVHPRHNGQWPLALKDFHTRYYPLPFLSHLNSWERAQYVPYLNVECQTRELLVPFL